MNLNDAPDRTTALQAKLYSAAKREPIGATGGLAAEPVSRAGESPMESRMRENLTSGLGRGRWRRSRPGARDRYPWAPARKSGNGAAGCKSYRNGSTCHRASGLLHIRPPGAVGLVGVDCEDGPAAGELGVRHIQIEPRADDPSIRGTRAMRLPLFAVNLASAMHRR
jgi:hypothetical protein